MRFDLNLLRVLVAIYETHNITTAASLLNMSQPAASAALGRLRESLNDPLFIRSPTGMTPTPRTLDIIEKAKEILGSVERDILTKPTFDPQHATDEFVLCMTAIAEYVFLPRLIPALKEHAPLTSIRSITLTPDDLQERMLSGKVDLAVGFYPDLASADIYQQRLFSHRLVCLVRQGHPILESGMTLEAFQRAEHVEVRDGSRTSEMFEQTLQNRKIDRNIVLTVSQFMGIPRIVAETNLVAVAPHIIAAMFADKYNLQVVTLPLNLSDYDIKQYWHRKFNHHPRLVWLRTMIQREFSKNYIADLMSSFGPSGVDPKSH
jgi:DNA-binding transcriptional LysR family regulator